MIPTPTSDDLHPMICRIEEARIMSRKDEPITLCPGAPLCYTRPEDPKKCNCHWCTRIFSDDSRTSEEIAMDLFKVQ